MVSCESQVTGHQHLCQNNPTLRRLIEMRNPYIDPINIFQVLTHCMCSC
jgi:phosphoenolpyruvate carboxylase